MDGNPQPNETKQQARRHTRSIAAIGESEEWLFTTLQSIGDAVIATDAQGFIVFMNTVAVESTKKSVCDTKSLIGVLGPSHRKGIVRANRQMSGSRITSF